MTQRSIAQQDEQELGGQGSVLCRQRRDHAAIQEIMLAYADAHADPDRARAVDRLTDRALRHAFAEETVLFPAVRRYVPDRGEELTAHIEGEHQEVNELLAGLRTMRPGDPGYDGAVRRAITLIRDDARNEEDRLLPLLQAAAGPAALRSIGAAWETARLTAPNLPHPEIPRRPWGNVVAGIPLAVTDRLERLGRVGVTFAAGAVALVAVIVEALRRRSP
jgi:hypothetical protein